MIKKQTEIAIVGGGISGLSLAHFLKKQGCQVLLIEKKSKVGGVIDSFRQDGFLVETGPNSLLNTHPILETLMEDLGIADQMLAGSKAANKRYILRGGVLHPLPMGPISFLKTPLFSWQAKLRLMLEPFIRSAPPHLDESLGDFVRRRLGQEFLDYAINPFVAGVYAASPEKISVKSALPKLYTLEQTYGSLIKGAILGRTKRKRRAEKAKVESSMFSFRDGLGFLIEKLRESLSAEIWTNTALTGLSQGKSTYQLEADHGGEPFLISAKTVVMALPAYEYKKLTFGPGLSPPDSLDKIAYSPVAVVYFGLLNHLFSSAGRTLDGFGFLVPEKEKRSILGTLWSSSIFSHRGPKGSISLTTFVGGDRQPDLAFLSKEELLSLVQKELGELMGICSVPEMTWLKLWPRAIPQYYLGHSHIVKSLENYEKKHPNLYLRGSFRGGVSVSDCILKGSVLAEELGGK